MRAYLDTLLPDAWDKMSLSERRMYLREDEFPSNRKSGTTRRLRVCNLEIWAECFGKDPAAITKQDSYAIAGIMKKIGGWARYTGNKAGKLSFSNYGVQLAYVRMEEPSRSV